MTEDSFHISVNINKMLYNALNGTVFKKKIADNSYSKKKAIEEAIYNIVIESGFLNEEEKELLKKALNIE